MSTYTTIDEYLAQCPAEQRPRLEQLRAALREAAPDASEKISWQMPTLYQQGNLVHFCAHSNHIGFYPGSSGVEHFSDKLVDYKTSKGAIQLPNSQPLPLALVQEITRFRVTENLAMAEAKKAAKAKKTDAEPTT